MVGRIMSSGASFHVASYFNSLVWLMLFHFRYKFNYVDFYAMYDDTLIVVVLNIDDKWKFTSYRVVYNVWV